MDNFILLVNTFVITKGNASIHAFASLFNHYENEKVWND